VSSRPILTPLGTGANGYNSGMSEATPPRVVSFAFTPADIEQRPEDRYARVAANRVTLAVNHGIVGDTKGRAGRRQLNVMRAETMAGLRAEGFRTGPGELGEQIVIAGLEDADLKIGRQFQLGDAVIEVTLPREPCGRFAHIQGKPKETAEGRIGVMARVVVGGDVAVGDAVRELAVR
jgi:MOSC domain-containing protein YiiM